MAVEVLKQSKNLLPLADNLKIISRCIDVIASKACVEQIASSFSRLEYSSSGRLHMSRQVKGKTDWWIKDLSVLQVDIQKELQQASDRAHLGILAADTYNTDMIVILADP
ncbi:hypothetical protein Tco_0756581 [Tanacetum coccineum]